MKPRLFIGSSSESIAVAHAAQANLHRAAEVTAWDQSVFQLSQTSLDSLTEQLATCDFGLFVLAPDDLLQSRGTTSHVPRDNVIFELGLFVGLLGRERCFVLLPQDSTGLHLPTDLIGLKPGTYETGRSDGSLVAATAIACHQVTDAIARLGIRQGRKMPRASGDSPTPEPPLSTEQRDEAGAAAAAARDESLHSDWSWFTPYMRHNYAEALRELSIVIDRQKNTEDQVHFQCWVGTIKFEISPSEGEKHLEDLIAKHPDIERPYWNLCLAYSKTKNYAKQLTIAERGLEKFPSSTALISNKANALTELGRLKEAESCLMTAEKMLPNDETLPVALATHYAMLKDTESALMVLEAAADRIPNSSSILSKYAILLSEDPDKRLALVPFQQLLSLNPTDTQALGYQANAFLELRLLDLAMNSYREGDKQAGGQQAWLQANIGNLLSNLGLYTDAIGYFKNAIALVPDSDYAHDRLATALKKRQSELERKDEVVREGQRLLDQARATRRLRIQAKTVDQPPPS